MTAPDGENIDVTVDLEDNLSRPAREAAEAVDDLGDNAKQTDRRLAALQRQADKTGRSLEFLALKTRAANMEFDTAAERVSWIADQLRSQVKPQIDKTTASLSKQTKETKKNGSGWKFLTNILGRFTRIARGVPKLLMGISKGLLAVLAVAAGASALQNILSIISALTTLGSLAGFLPTLISSLASTMITLKVATSGVSTAIGAALKGDVTKLNAAMKELSPSAQDFVMDIEDMSGAFKNLKKSVQENFFKPFAVFTKPVLQETIVPITKGMREVAKSAGYVVAKFLLFFRTFEGKNLIRMFFDSGKRGLDALMEAIDPLLHGIESVMSVIEPFWKHFTELAGKAGAAFGKWLEDISDSGQLKDWIDTALDVLKQLGGVAKNVFGIIKGLMSAVGDGQGLSPLLNFLQEVNKWVNSTEGHDALVSFFDALKQILVALAPALKIIANAIGTTLAPAIAGIVQGLAPGFVTFLQAFADALAIIAPYLPPLAEQLGALLEALAPLMKPLAELVAVIAKGLIMAMQILAPIIGTIASALATLLAPFLEATLAVFKAIEPYIPAFTDLIVQMAEAVAPVIKQIADIFSKYLNQYLEELTTEILPELMPVLAEFIKVLGTYLMEALKVITPYIPTLAKFMIMLMERSASLWPILFQVAIIFLKLATAMLPMVGIVLKILNVFVLLFIGVNNAVTKIINFIGKLLGFIQGIPGKVKNALSSVADTFIAPFKRAYEEIKTLISKIKSLISSTSISDAVKSVTSAALNPFRFAGGPVEAGQTYNVGEIGKEMYVPNIGTPQIVGEGGMEARKFAHDGMIIPSYMLNAMESNAAMMRKHAANQEKASLPTLSRTENHTHYHNHEGDHLEAKFTGNMTADVDIERAMSRFYKNMQREEAERR